MSITEIPLVAAYRSVLQTALEHSSTSKASNEWNEAIEAFQNIRNQDGAASDAPAHDLAVESAVREKFIGLVSSSDIHQSEFQQVWNLIDITNTLSENELSEPSLAFYLIEELLDSQTIDGCRIVFDYLESRRVQMIRKNFKTKSLVILRCCNELLRRLSRAEETVFCGRVFIYLFQTFPLGDRSSVNLRGVFHTENVTAYDESTQKSDDAIQPMEIDSEGIQSTVSRSHTPSSALVQDAENKTGRSTPTLKPGTADQKTESPPDLDALYPMFWSLQGLFSDPTKLFDTQSMQRFKDGIAATLSCFRYVSKHSAPATESLDAKRGVKRKIEDMVAGQGTNLASKFNPKYLTSRDLFDLEIHDIAFRRHFLVQALIMLDFLLSLSPTAKTKLTGLTNRSVLYAYTLSEDDTKWAQSTRVSIATYIQNSGIGSEGNLYYRMVDTVLARDKNWARWKAENCPPITRPAIDPETFLAAQKSLKELSRLPPMVNPPGSSDFNFLAQNQPLESLKRPSERHEVPTLEQYYRGIQGDDLDLEMATEEEASEIKEKKAGKLWRALRAAYGRRFVLCEEIKNGDNLAALVEQGTKKNGEDVNGHTEDDVDGNHDSQLGKEVEDTVAGDNEKDEGAQSAMPDTDVIDQQDENEADRDQNMTTEADDGKQNSDSRDTAADQQTTADESIVSGQAENEVEEGEDGEADEAG